MGAPIPHAALWVVQLEDFRGIKECAWSFNAARGFVGGAAQRKQCISIDTRRFNAARGFVGGAAFDLLKNVCSN